MNGKLEKAQDVFLDRVNQICNKFGLNNIMAQLYAILYLSNKPLSLNDMVERLNISKGSVSVNVRALERYGIVRRVWVKGSRRDYYEAETDISKVIIDRAKSMIQGRLSELEEMVNASYQALNLVDALDKDEEKKLKVFKERLDRLRSLHNRAQSLLNFFSSESFNSDSVNKIGNNFSSKSALVI